MRNIFKLLGLIGKYTPIIIALIKSIEVFKEEIGAPEIKNDKELK